MTKWPLLALSSLVFAAYPLPANFAHAKSLSTSSNNQQNSIRYLREALEDRTTKNVKAFMVTNQKFDFHIQRLIYTESIEGNKKTEYLFRGDHKGLIILDTSSTRTVYNPWRMTLSVGPEPSSNKSVSWQVNRIAANYNLSLSHAVSLGLPIIVISANSKYEGIPDRKLYIEPQSHFLMRQDISNSKGSHYIFATRQISFPDKLPDGTFSINISEGVKTETENAPHQVNSISEVRALAGSDAILKTNWPMGFQLYSAVKGANWQGGGVILDLSNGMEHVLLVESKRANTAPEIIDRLKHHDSLVAQKGQTVFRIYSSISKKVQTVLFQHAIS